MVFIKKILYGLLAALPLQVFSQTIFFDVTKELGVSVSHTGDETTVHGTGAAWLDYDNDGDLDLYVTNQYGGNHLFHNNLIENGEPSFLDVTTHVLSGEGRRGSGVSAADYNNDGLIDLYLCNLDDDVLLKNLGDGNFIDATKEAFSFTGDFQIGAGATASWGDINNDGWLDLYISNHAFGPNSEISTDDYLYLNNGDHPVTFTDISHLISEDADSSGIDDRSGYGFVSLFTDFNNDGLLDIFTTNDCELGYEGNKLWKNTGQVSFSEVSREVGPFTRGIRSSPHCFSPMGISVGDPNHDGLFDYHLTNLHGPNGENTVLLMNNGKNLFNVSRFSGLDDNVFKPVGGILATWGTVFIDYDLDTWQDIAVASGSLGTSYQPNILYQNQSTDIGGIPHFKEVSRSLTGMENGARARTIIMGDYDNDGDPDLYVCNYDSTSILYRNEHNTDNNWLIISLTGAGAPLSNRNGIGAKVKVTTPDNVNQYYEINSGSSIGGGNDIAAYFGLAKNTSASVEIRWPSGIVQKIAEVSSNQRINIREPDVNITNPGNGQFLKSGDYHNIRWTSSFLDDVDIILKHDSQSDKIIAASVENTGEYVWLIAEDITPDQSYWIEIMNSNNPTQSGKSNLFSVTLEKFISLNDFNSDQLIQQQDTIEIEWNQNTGEATSIYLLNRQDTLEIAQVAHANSGRYNWIVADSLEGNNYTILITSAGIFDKSDRSFSILSKRYEKDDLIVPVVDVEKGSIARVWNEMLLHSIRNDFARPTVHARNLFHISCAMYDAWAAYDNEASPYFLGNTIDDFFIPFDGIRQPLNTQRAQEEAISYAAYRLLKHRFRNSPGTNLSNEYDILFTTLGYNPSWESTDYSDGRPASLGNYIAEQIIAFGLQDGSNEQYDYANQYYTPVNAPIDPLSPGQSMEIDPNRWQPLAFDLFVDQSGNPIGGGIPDFLSPEWGNVIPFSLRKKNLTVKTRNGINYNLYHDPGDPVYLDTANMEGSNHYKWGFSLVSIWGAHLDPSDSITWDISPRSQGNINQFPQHIEDYEKFYDLIDGGDTGKGYEINLATGEPYVPQLVPRGDYTRVLAEFWADGPDSETPPGHWFTILNYVNDHPLFEKRFQGEGEILSDLEWDVKSYFTLGGAMHDAAIAAWSVKGYYDYVRPISAIRYMGMKGQSTDPSLPNYHPNGIGLIPGYIEIIKEGDPLAGNENQHLGKIKLKSWKGHDYIVDPSVDQAGVGWVLGEAWVPYQRPTFVTPPFAGFVSGHSTYSRTAAEVLTLLTGDEYFPGGMSEFVAKKDEFLVFEQGPSVDVVLQWAKYKDAADQCSLSRIWGGIHPPVDDIPGRIMGTNIGKQSFSNAKRYFSDIYLDNDNPKTEITIFPNPANSDIVNIATGVNTDSKVTLISLNGITLLERKYTGSHFQLQISDLPSGVYFIRVVTESTDVTSRFLKL